MQITLTAPQTVTRPKPAKTQSLRLGRVSTDALEAYIDSRYEANASQEELNALETEYSKRVSEEDLNITEEDPNIGEEMHSGASLEEQLCHMFHRYITPNERCGMDPADIIGNMRASLEQYAHGKLINPTDERVLSAAKDVYEYRKNLIDKYRSGNKISNIPSQYLPGKSKFAFRRSR